ncbi:MAG: dipeptide epimerase [Hyphomicrobiaceae bacterium]
MPIVETTDVHVEAWPLNSPFRISRGAKSEATIVTVSLSAEGYYGHGECCPYARYGESVAGTAAALRDFDWRPFANLGLAEQRHALQQQLPPGSVRNGLDCALWDLAAKIKGRPAWQDAGLVKPGPLMTCFTLSLDTPEAMAAEAKQRTDCPLLKLKLGDGLVDARRMQMVRDARPDARLVCDANEGWSTDDLAQLIGVAAQCRFELIEQPLAENSDTALELLTSDIPICADEAAAPGIEIASLVLRYQAINIKLDKVGGITAALAAIAQARQLGLKIMIGSMVSTSLSMAPAALLGNLADWVDLDSPLLLSRDRPHGMKITDGFLAPPTPELWG